MSGYIQLPPNIAERAQKRGWFRSAEAAEVLDWLESQNARFLGFDVAEQTADGSWMLLIQPIQDLSASTDKATALRLGREFLTQHQADNRIFEPVWEGRYI
jgi:hypothetical protein